MEAFIPLDCGIPAEERARVEWLLTTIGTGEGPGRLPAPVHRVEVVRQLPGGRSGARVLEVKVLCGTPESEVWYVVKLQDAREARAEWRAYGAHMTELKAAYLTEITAVSQSLLDDGDLRAGDLAAVVYLHVSERMGEPGLPLVTLEQLAREAVAGSPEAARRAGVLIDRLLRRLRATLSRSARPHPTSRYLRRLNPRLGADLVVELDEDADPGDAVRDVFPADLLTASCASGTGTDDPRFAVGSWISVPVGRAQRRDGALLVYPSGDTRIEVRPLKEAVRRLGVSEPDDQGMCRVTGPLRARVVTTRVLAHWDLVRELLGDEAVVEARGLRLAGQFLGHPFARLRSVLCDDAEGWVSATVHDDLNPRNVLTADDTGDGRGGPRADEPFLIDHARADDGLPLLGDPAWLEVNLLRAVVAPVLDRAELVRLCRRLAVACRHGEAAAAGAPDGGEPDAFRVAFGLLWRVRAAARDGYPADGRQPWWREYLAQLTLAACRTLKWSPPDQDAHSVAAALVAAGVAGEFLGGEADRFAYWPSGELHEVAARVLPVLDPGRPDELGLLLEVLTALDQRPGGRAQATVREAVRSACDRAVRELCATAGEQRLHRLLRGRTAYIALHGSVSGDTAAGAAEPPGDALRLAAAYESVTVVGRAGAGKSTLLGELEYLYVRAVTGETTDPALPPRMPLSTHAADLAAALGTPDGYGAVLARACTAGSRLGADTCGRLLVLRGIQLLVDGLDEVPPEGRAAVLRWLRELRTAHRDTPVVLCQRTSAYATASAAGPLPMPVITLHAVTTEQARRYATERLPDGTAAPWFASLLDGGQRGGGTGEAPTGSGVPELLRTPLFLWMAVEAHGLDQAPPRTAGDLFAVFTTWYLTERHHRQQTGAEPASRFTAEERLDVLEAVAEQLVEHGPVPLARMAPRLAEVRPDWRDVLDEVVATQFVEVSHGLVRFRHELFQAYCAGRVLARLATRDEAGLLRRVLRFEWQEPARMMVGLPDVDADVRTRVWQCAARADARYAAWLMREAPTVPEDWARAFLDRQREVLGTASAAAEEWDRAAVALTLLRADAAWAALGEVAASADVAPGAAVACLRAMGAAVRGDGAGPGRAGGGDAARTALRGAVVAVLERAAPVAVEAAAVRAIGQARLAPLSGYLTERVDAGRPWPVVREAAAALEALDVALTPGARAARDAACRARLAAADAEAWEATRLTDGTALARERGELLAVVARSGGPDALELLLEHRFRPGLADLPHWSDLLSGAARERRATADDDRLAALLLTGTRGDGQERALAAFAEGSDREAVAAAHRLLSDGEVPPRHLLDLVSPDSSGPRLLAAAAVVEGLAASELALAESLVRGLVDRPRAEDPQWLEGLAALIGAVGQQSRVLRVRLLHAAARVVEAGGAERAMRGPWAQVYYAADIDHDVLTALLEQDDEDGHQLALDYMSGMDFLLTAVGRPEPLTLSPGARARVLAYQPDSPAASPADVLRFVQAVAYAGMTEALPFVEAVAGSEEAAGTLVTFGHSHHGVVELALSAHAVTAVGWFGRLAGERRRPDALRQAHTWLRQLDTRGGHPSVERARLVGLGLLGDWLPVLRGLEPGDPVLHEAATAVVLHWLPVPWRTSPPDDPRSVAAWLTERLASGEVTSGEVKDVLAGMVTALSRRLGRYLEEPSAPAGDGRWSW
ncbi:hypothetical protein [Streptomyces sp. NPDC006997]|uniref:hypothetical protein n=1 Tax=Streptomyces sp. NPDC006997 TaxID=3155356 RepID=UPI0034060290